MKVRPRRASVYPGSLLRSALTDAHEAAPASPAISARRHPASPSQNKQCDYLFSTSSSLSQRRTKRPVCHLAQVHAELCCRLCELDKANLTWHQPPITAPRTCTHTHTYTRTYAHTRTHTHTRPLLPSRQTPVLLTGCITLLDTCPAEPQSPGRVSLIPTHLLAKCSQPLTHGSFRIYWHWYSPQHPFGSSGSSAAFTAQCAQGSSPDPWELSWGGRALCSAEHILNAEKELVIGNVSSHGLQLCPVWLGPSACPLLFYHRTLSRLPADFSSAWGDSWDCVQSLDSLPKAQDEEGS